MTPSAFLHRHYWNDGNPALAFSAISAGEAFRLDVFHRTLLSSRYLTSKTSDKADNAADLDARDCNFACCRLSPHDKVVQRDISFVDGRSSRIGANETDAQVHTATFKVSCMPRHAFVFLPVTTTSPRRRSQTLLVISPPATVELEASWRPLRHNLTSRLWLFLRPGRMESIGALHPLDPARLSLTEQDGGVEMASPGYR